MELRSSSDRQHSRLSQSQRIQRVHDGQRIDVNGAHLAVGLALLIVSSVAAVILFRHLSDPDNPLWSPGTAMMLLIVNLIQLLALVIALVALFDDGAPV